VNLVQLVLGSGGIEFHLRRSQGQPA
jgi:hypothetical protein